jgi:catechol 2,3-dioxygenase-like lactoylglutathione lyase family enzyme
MLGSVAGGVGSTEPQEAEVTALPAPELDKTEAAPLVTGLEVVYIYVADVERSAAFYRGLLGIPLEGDEHWQEARLGGTRFALHQEGPGYAATGSTGGAHINFRVDDVDAAAERLRAQGVEVREQMREEYGVAYALHDPDGYEVFIFGMPR